MRGNPEARLLVLCLKLELDPARAQEARGILTGPLARSLDWERLLLLGAQARVLPLLHWQARRHALPFPERTAARLRAAYVRSAAEAEAQAGLERRVLGELASRGGRTVLLKGAALRRSLYPDPALRPMTDLDLWVHPGDLDAADAAARSSGLHRSEAPASGTWAGRRRLGCEAAYRDASGRLALELHWGLQQYERYRGILALPPDRIWEESRPAPGAPAARFLPAWLEPLYLAFHAGAVHGFGGTLWILDLSEWLGRYGAGVDWDQALDEGARLGVLKAFAWGVRLAERIAAGTPLPPFAARRLRRALGAETLWAGRMGGPFCAEREYAVPTGLSRLKPLLALDGWDVRAKALGRGLLPSRELRRYRAALRAFP